MATEKTMGAEQVKKYRISLEKLKEVGITPQVGKELVLNLKDGKQLKGKVLKIEDGNAIFVVS